MELSAARGGETLKLVGATLTFVQAAKDVFELPDKIFFLRLTKCRFSLELCDISIDYTMGVRYQTRAYRFWRRRHTEKTKGRWFRIAQFGRRPERVS